MRRTCLLAAAFLAGASGMALQALLLGSAGLALGYGDATALGLATFLAAWALGARAAARFTSSARPALLVAGAALAALAVPALVFVLAAGGALAGRSWTAPAALVAIAAVAALQGLFLPLLSSADRGAPDRSVAALYAVNFCGSLVGAALVAERAVLDHGRLGAAGIAAACACSAGALGAWAARRAPPTADRASRSAPVPADSKRALGPAACAAIVGLGTAWMAQVEWTGLRLGALWFGGMQPALSAILCAALLALALGAAIVPLAVPRDGRGVLAVLALAALTSPWPWIAPRVLGGTTPSAGGDLWERATLMWRAAVLVGPPLVAFGALVPCVHRASRAARESGDWLGRLLVHEAWGALVGIPLVHLVVVPRFGNQGAIAFGLALGALALLAARRASPRAAVLAAAGALGLGIVLARAESPALASPPLANPALRVRAFAEDRDFAVAVVDDGLLGERTLLTDGFRAAGTGRDYRYMQALGHLPLLHHPAPRRVAVLALGTGTTVGAVALHPEVERVDVLELSRAVVAASTWFAESNHGVLGAEPLARAARESDTQRVRVSIGDGRRTLARATGAYDVITMEPLLPDAPAAVYLYTREFYALARRALAPGGIVCQWVPPHALEPATFEAVMGAFGEAFPWSAAWLSGTQVVLLGADVEPALVPERFPPADGALGQALLRLGLGTPADVRARRVGAPRAFAGRGRALTDEDPWIAYRPRRAGRELLSDNPSNLERLIETGGNAADRPGLDGAADRARAAQQALRAARVAWARAEAGSIPAGSHARDLSRARDLAPGDPEIAAFAEDVEFLGALRAGVASLGRDASPDAARAALPDLVRAVELRRERGDAHLYLACALDRAGSAAAERALNEALERCPAIALTTAGARARALGLRDALRERLEASGRGARSSPAAIEVRGSADCFD